MESCSLASRRKWLRKVRDLHSLACDAGLWSFLWVICFLIASPLKDMFHDSETDVSRRVRKLRVCVCARVCASVRLYSTCSCVSVRKYACACVRQRKNRGRGDKQTNWQTDRKIDRPAEVSSKFSDDICISHFRDIPISHGLNIYKNLSLAARLSQSLREDVPSRRSDGLSVDTSKNKSLSSSALALASS